MVRAYLAGPDIVRKNALEYFNMQKEICLKYGITPLHPIDNPQASNANTIYESDIKMLESADIVIANFNPYAGMLVDDGTAFECGYAKALNKRIYGYLSDDRYYELKVLNSPNFDEFQVKGIKQYVNLMLEQSAYKVVIGTFEDCVKEVSKDYNLNFNILTKT
ncbi:MAG: nucleoside 2-deoxyribosyltransferase [Tenericutes bacterium]|nr:nucleoside 2-deoxyribosyltransferase [Mycoplasmatota bacterium]